MKKIYSLLKNYLTCVRKTIQSGKIIQPMRGKYSCKLFNSEKKIIRNYSNLLKKSYSFRMKKIRSLTTVERS